MKVEEIDDVGKITSNEMRLGIHLEIRLTARCNAPVIFLAGQAVTDHPMARTISQTMTSPPWLRFLPWVSKGPKKMAQTKPAAMRQASSEKSR